MEEPLYECMRCESRWTEKTPHPTGCPICMHVYVEWVNYESMFGKDNESGKASQR